MRNYGILRRVNYLSIGIGGSRCLFDPYPPRLVLTPFGDFADRFAEREVCVAECGGCGSALVRLPLRDRRFEQPPLLVVVAALPLTSAFFESFIPVWP